MSLSKSSFLLAAAAMAFSPLAHAQGLPPTKPIVTVQIASSLAPKAKRLGDSEVREMADELKSEVQKALASGKNQPAFVRVDLVLVDLQPNRPTFTQLGDHPGLSERSVALGGAAISGTVTFADGRTQALASNYYGTSLRDNPWPGPWLDAETAFDDLADSLGHGRTPHDRPVTVATDDSFGSWLR